MRRLFFLPILLLLSCALHAQYNMEAFRHLSIDVEAGLCGIGVDVAIPVGYHLVLKGGYNKAPAMDYFNTAIMLNTADLKEEQERYEKNSAAIGENYVFHNRFSGESVVNAGARLGQDNYKFLLNWYPFAGGKFYLAGGVYYSRLHEKDDFLTLEGHTTANDWAALKELNEKTGTEHFISVMIGDESYPLYEDESGYGHFISGLRIDPIKYYAGIGVGRCIPNRFLGLQLEIGALAFRNAELFCQGKSVGSLEELSDGSLGGDVKDLAESMGKYPFYPQMTLRLCFRLF